MMQHKSHLAMMFLLWNVLSAVGNNIVTNGDFLQGNTGFQTQLQYSPSDLRTAGTYAIIESPYLVHSGFGCFADRTTGDGLMMVINGPESPQTIWKQNVTVNPNTTYIFSFWVVAAYSDNPPILAVSIGDNIVVPRFVSSKPVGH